MGAGQQYRSLLVLLYTPSCKWVDSRFWTPGLRRDKEVQDGTLSTFWAVRYGATSHPRGVATLPMSDRRPPAGLVGIPRHKCLAPVAATPTLPASEA